MTLKFKGTKTGLNEFTYIFTIPGYIYRFGADPSLAETMIKAPLDAVEKVQRIFERWFHGQ